MAMITINNLEYRFDESRAVDIAIPLRFDGPQPSAYGVEPATSVACEYGALVGDTRRSGGCNFERITVIPHCNGTHTECVGHITHQRISVRDCLKDVLISAILISVEPVERDSDQILDAKTIAAAVGNADADALVVRTLPNDASKLIRSYNESNVPPYFSADAMEFIADRFKHLLVDLPSIDRLYDEGKLENHRIFWKVKPGSFEKDRYTRVASTVTELIYVPSSVADGDYLLNLQIAPFESDAAPSRPMLFPLL
jgi:arylformamidase